MRKDRKPQGGLPRRRVIDDEEFIETERNGALSWSEREDGSGGDWRYEWEYDR